MLCAPVFCQSWACGRCLASVCRSRAWHTPCAQQVPAIMTVTTPRSCLGPDTGLRGWERRRGPRSLLSPRWEAFMVCLSGMMSPQGPSRCDSSDPTLFCHICPLQPLPIEPGLPVPGALIPSTGPWSWEGIPRGPAHLLFHGTKPRPATYGKWVLAGGPLWSQRKRNPGCYSQ